MNITLEQAAALVREAESILIAAGAGMGVDSGLPDFRGDRGFWNAYPAFERLGLHFVDLAQPSWFASDPELAWGFYGHRLNLYRATAPHAGFDILRDWSRTRATFVYTSNVDGAFQKAGFAESGICEVHGTIHHLQCTRPCRRSLWPAATTQVTVDPESCRAVGELPQCPNCGALARPNILLFGDDTWIEDRSDVQEQNLRLWLTEVATTRLLVLEFGAGLAIPTVRSVSEQVGRYSSATLVRVNPREAQVPTGQYSYAGGSLEFLRGIEAILGAGHTSMG